MSRTSEWTTRSEPVGPDGQIVTWRERPKPGHPDTVERVYGTSGAWRYSAPVGGIQFIPGVARVAAPSPSPVATRPADTRRRKGGQPITAEERAAALAFARSPIPVPKLVRRKPWELQGIRVTASAAVYHGLSDLQDDELRERGTLLLGRVTAREIYITEMYSRILTGTPHDLSLTEVRDEAERIAKARNLAVVGSIHSHRQPEAVIPSDQDLRHWRGYADQKDHAFVGLLVAPRDTSRITDYNDYGWLNPRCAAFLATPGDAVEQLDIRWNI